MASLPNVQVTEKPGEKFAEFLSLKGKRYTKSHRALVEHIFSYHDHFTADDLVRDVREKNGASRATIYRRIKKYGLLDRSS